MKKDNNMFYAEQGKLIVRKADDFVMGDAICLGDEDKIENYEEREFSEEEIAAFQSFFGGKERPDDNDRKNRKLR